MGCDGGFVIIGRGGMKLQLVHGIPTFVMWEQGASGHIGHVVVRMASADHRSISHLDRYGHMKSASGFLFRQ